MLEETRTQIASHLERLLEDIITRRVQTEPFSETEVYRKNPFGARVLPMEVWKGSKMERSFVTSLGQNFFEQVARLIALGTGAEAINQHTIEIQINTFRNTYINDLLSAQRARRVRGDNQTLPNWQNEITGLVNLNNRDVTTVEIISDLYVRRLDGREEFYSMKTVKPNLDQTELAKRNMLRLIAYNANYSVYFALPYNPAGEGQVYRRAGHTIPYKLFDMDNDMSVLIGAEFWNKLGENDNTYNELLEIFEDVGKRYSIPKILTDYFNL